MKELEDAPEPRIISHVGSHPTTARGLAELKKKLARATDESSRAELQREIDSAVVVEPPKDRSVVAFGAKVTVAGASAEDRTFSIVGDFEMDIPNGKITQASPLGQALLGKRVGDEAIWRRPAGNLPLRIKAIAYD